MILLYNGAIAEIRAENEILSYENIELHNQDDFRRLISTLANGNRGSGQSGMGSFFPRKNAEGFSSWRKKATKAGELRNYYRVFNGDLSDDTPDIDDGTSQGEDDGTIPDYN